MSIKPACRRTHDFIVSGPCPYCDCEIADGRPIPDSAGRKSGVTRWNLAAMERALDDEDMETRSLAIPTTSFDEYGLADVLPIFRKALANSDSGVRRLASFTLPTRWGRGLSGDEVDELERLATASPDDFALRLVLLGHYSHKGQLTPAEQQARQRHVLWVIKNAPESEVTGTPFAGLNPQFDGEAYNQGKQLWLQQVEEHRRDPAVLGNAARFLTLMDKELSETLLKKAQSLDPDNPEWPRRLAHLHSLRVMRRTGEARREAAVKALEEAEKALGMETDEIARLYFLPDLAKTAFEARELEKAGGYAQKLLDKAAERDYYLANEGDAIHWGNLILGRLALRAGHVEKAKAHLLEAGKTSGSPVLLSFGPNMTLAKELLEMGEKEVVIQYLELCAKFWQTPNHQPELWIHVIQQGGIPDFRGNL